MRIVECCLAGLHKKQIKQVYLGYIPHHFIYEKCYLHVFNLWFYFFFQQKTNPYLSDSSNNSRWVKIYYYQFFFKFLFDNWWTFQSGNENAWALMPLPRRALLVTIFAGKTF